MLRGKGDYRIERWSAGGVPLACVRPPEALAPAPVVIVYHRFSGRNTDEMLRLALPLADSGIAAVLPEAALHGERTPRDFDERLADDRDGLFTDVLDATVREADDVLAWVDDRGELDPTRIGVVGTSMGGDLVPHYSDAPERLRFVDMPGEDHRVGAYWIEETLSWLGRFL
jgi:dienelactone hydrolase